MDEENMALATDLYQLTMAAAYFQNSCTQRATFEMFVRKLPEHRSFLVSAGQEQVLHHLQHLRFSGPVVDFLRRHPVFKSVSPEFFDFLLEFRFQGDVWAMPEGTLVFPTEPILRVTAPIIQSQIIETYLLSHMNFQTSIASKAARLCLAAEGRAVVEFGSRRAHGPQAALLAARAAYVGGCAGTSNVLAGYLLGIPIYGTIAHSYVMSFDSETEAFRRYFNVFPENSILLVDTYDTLEGVQKALDMKVNFRGVRLDSGDLLGLSRRSRQLLDRAGLRDALIVGSGDLNEEIIFELTSHGAPIDVFGVGTELATSKDAPALGGIYKLVEEQKDSQAVPKAKFSSDKATYGGAKQAFRVSDERGKFVRDILALADEQAPRGGQPLLEQCMEGGVPVGNRGDVHATRRYVADQLGRLPGAYQRLYNAETYPVQKSPKLEEVRRELEEQYRGQPRS
ncbi:MAG: nicotinate phosphoribosyltransferase [Acidobacteria bacterium]|nr:nicotinate phosphoribosyltransferase [Acidobacteriota bacterium]